MTKCPLCKKDSNRTCLCGFCQDCLDEFKHEGCYAKLEALKDEKKLEYKS